MKTITFNSNYSAYSYRMNAEVGEDLTPATLELCMQGVANICYRTVGSNVDKKLGVKSKKNGGMGRDGITFDPAHIPTIEAAVSEKITELEKDEKNGAMFKAMKLSFAVTGEYVKGETASSKEAEALWTQVQALPGDKFETALKKLGLAEDYDDASGIAACQRHIQAEKRAAAERAKAGLGL